MTNICESIEFFPPDMHGGRKGKSTDDAIMSLVLQKEFANCTFQKLIMLSADAKNAMIG